jgi:2-keto-4-pentenoate hydratase
MEPSGLDIEALTQALQQAEKNHEPIALLGASYSMVHAMDALIASGVAFQTAYIELVI